MARGIEKRRIFANNADRDNFLLRLADILKETKTGLLRLAALKISVPAVSKSVIRGEKLAKAGKYALIK